MAVVSMMRFTGDTDDLARRMKDVAEVIRPLAERHGGLAYRARSDRRGGRPASTAGGCAA